MTGKRNSRCGENATAFENATANTRVIEWGHRHTISLHTPIDGEGDEAAKSGEDLARLVSEKCQKTLGKQGKIC